ncbi:uroporphyrinogen-III synthase [Vibrio sp. 10N.286.49.B3]|uniref:uroporphyrinogen-III synthase n=1 Tax=Vibrio sp. 10N.286.49.B3 TaxID=1880855 RepID=UPI000C823FEE|nr:uroporphyrinogen-III synthase [Vibrio sp. 10N.286.49.B3]PMH45458.1 uroporphyrinogen-III synthase [Vibrio sp. 10N.286.49.B3]
MAVLVTRPDQQGLTLCQQLADIGVSALHCPLIRIVENPAVSHLFKQLHDADIVIAVSQHAVSFAEKKRKEKHSKWPKGIIYLAVGQKTAHSLSKYCQLNVNYPLISDSEHLLKLAELSNITDKHILILRGNGGRELLKETLTQRGAYVEYSEVYQRELIPLPDGDIFLFWQEQNIEKIVVTSSEQLNHLISQTPKCHLTWLLQRHLLVPSQRILQDATLIGFIHVTNVGSASNIDLLAALQP